MEMIDQRLHSALEICKDAGALALKKYQNLSQLTVEKKGLQDLVSEADKEVEKLIRESLHKEYPNDGIIGEEYSSKQANQSPYCWVVDPIDGTANYLRGIPIWVVVMACLKDNAIVVGVVYDPIHDEMFYAKKNGGAFLNDKSLNPLPASGLDNGLTGIGTSHHPSNSPVFGLLEDLASQGGVFCRCGSGALGIVYAACGRYIGFLESHMNAWDCLASLLIVQESGGMVMDFDMETMLSHGGKVVASNKGVEKEFWKLAKHFTQ